MEIKNFSPRIKKEKNIISLTRNCLVEEALFDLEAKRGDILFFKDDGQKELIDTAIENIIMTYRLEMRKGKDGTAQRLYFVGDTFNTAQENWYSKEFDPEKHEELKKRLN